MSFDTVGTVVHVWNEGSGLPEGERWGVRQLGQIGSLTSSAEESLSSALVSTIPGASGHVFVLDFRAARAVEFDDKGRFVRQWGRRGEGPGEFRSPTGIALDDEGRLWVAEGSGARYNAFDSNGEFAATFSRPVRVPLKAQQQLAVDGRGRILDVGVRGVANQQLVFTYADPWGETVDTAWVVDMPFRGSAPSQRIPPGSAYAAVVRYYLETLVWALGTEGTLWVAPTGGAELVQLSPGGDTLRVIRVSHRPLPLSGSEERLVDTAARETGIARSDWNIVPSVIQAIRSTSDGYLLVFVKEHVDRGASRVEVYEPSGRYLGVTSLGFEIPNLGVVGLRGDTLVAPTVGPFDATFVVQAVFDRPMATDRDYARE